MQQVDYLIIGAGLAGMVVKRFLENQNTVLVDPDPGGYKIGESIIPEHFRHPALRADVPLMQRQPSYSPKWGTTFIADGSVASFPLPEEEVGVAMHITRSEMERVMLDAWDVDVVRERVTDVDIEGKVVTTSGESYRVARQIIDCSGPAMVVARKLGLVKKLWPVYATWGYFDITGFDPSALADHIEKEGWRWGRYDARHRSVLPVEEVPGWHLARTTTLTKLGDGRWSWQIPLNGESLLSFGVVSKHGAVSREELLDTARTSAAPGYSIEPHVGDSAHGRIHVRNNFAVTADTPATLDYILVSDAFAFADPIYSVGTGLAVNKALEVAGMLNAGSWNQTALNEYCSRYATQLARAVQGFDFWYSGKIFESDGAAAEVQDNLLVGSAFQTEVARRYCNALRDADLTADAGERDAFDVDWKLPARTNETRELLGSDASFSGWSLAAANSAHGGLALRWRHGEHPELTLLVSPSDTGGLSVFYKNLLEGPYPSSPELTALVDRISELTREGESAWRALL